MEPTPRVISSIRQLMTFKWFEHLEAEFRMFATQKVRTDFESEGISKPDDCADLLDDLAMLEVNDDVRQVANDVIPEAFYRLDSTPDRFRPHPIHIAAATVHGLDFMLTWDCVNSYILQPNRQCPARQQLHSPDVQDSSRNA